MCEGDLTPSTPLPQRGSFRSAVALARPFTLLAPALGVVCSSGVAAAATRRTWDVGVVGLAIAAALSATAASNAWNQVFDVDVDRRNKPTRPIPAGEVSTRFALMLGDVSALAALLLAALVGVSYLACVAVGVLATWVYSAPPLRLKRKTLAALVTIALPRGFLVPVAGWLVVAPATLPDPWALGAVAALFVLGAAATKDFADIEGDAADGSRTLPVLLGVRRAARVVAPFLVLPFLLYPVFAAVGWLSAPIERFAVLAIVLVALGLWTARALVKEPAGRAAWRGMYLLLLASQVGTLLVYVL